MILEMSICGVHEAFLQGKKKGSKIKVVEVCLKHTCQQRRTNDMTEHGPLGRRQRVGQQGRRCRCGRHAHLAHLHAQAGIGGTHTTCPGGTLR